MNNRYILLQDIRIGNKIIEPAAVTHEDTRIEILHEMELRYTKDVIFTRYPISLRTIQRMRRSYNSYGVIWVPPIDPGGRPRLLSASQLLGYLKERLSSYLDETANYLFDEWDMSINESTVFRALRGLRSFRTTQRGIAAQRNAKMRDGWVSTVEK